MVGHVDVESSVSLLEESEDSLLSPASDASGLFGVTFDWDWVKSVSHELISHVVDMNSVSLGSKRWAISSFLEVPSLVETVVAVPPGDWLVVSVLSSPDVKAQTVVVSEVLSVSSEPGDLLDVSLTVVVWSGDGESSLSEELSSLVSNDESSVFVGSDGSGSAVKSPEVSLKVRYQAFDSQSVLSSRHGSGIVVENSVSWEDRSDDEGLTVSNWIPWWVESSRVKEPDLVVTVVAVPPSDYLVVDQSVMDNIQALSSQVSEVLSLSLVELKLLIVVVFELSDNSGSTDSVFCIQLVGNDQVSVLSESDGVGSSVMDEPVSLVPRWRGVDSQSVAIRDSRSLVNEESH